MKTLDLVYFNAGGGHRAAAHALRDVIVQQRRPWRVRLVNLTHVLDPASRLRDWTGLQADDLYNLRLRMGWTFGMSQELRLLQAGLRWAHAPMLRRLGAHWARTQPDLVVSLVPNFNRVLHESVRQGAPEAPFATVMTDLADHPPHFWIEPGQDQTIVCGSARAAEQARAAGYDGDRLVLTSGMPLRPSFYTCEPTPIEEGRRALGLQPLRPTGLVMFGGQGSREMLRIARDLDDVQLIFLCGHHGALARRLRSLQRRAPHAAIGFTDDVPALMRLADFFIGKPGPGCMSEAVQMGLPVITWCNAATLPQERYNTEWLQDHGLGLVVRSPRHLRSAVQRLVADLGRFHAATTRMDNRAIFELPEVFAGLLMQAARRAPASTPQAIESIVLATA